MLLLQSQHLNLLVEGFFFVKIRTVYDVFDFFQRKLQLTEQQNLLQPLKGCLAVQPVTSFTDLVRMKQSYLVVIMQCAHTDSA